MALKAPGLLLKCPTSRIPRTSRYQTALAPVPTYAGGMLALVAAGESHKALPEVHWAAFTPAPGFKPVSAHREASTEGSL
jgi:hypothetical protein